MNVATIIGRVGRVNDLRRLPDGTPVLGFSVAHTLKRKNQEVTTWFDCGLFGVRAEAVQPHIRVGDPIGVTGAIALNVFTDRTGKTSAAIKLTVNDVMLLGQKPNNNGGGNKPQQERKKDNFDDNPF
ncbi:MAG: single-stranded DNA-binding protein [Magnetococcales bacterium]|nr:single-stranded DNA-binding protein [Magnetococcales bacterium]